MKLVLVRECEKLRYQKLLLLGDEQMDMVARYLYRGQLFALYDGVLKAICVVTQEGPGVFELKNIAVVPAYQRQGYGKALLSLIEEHYRPVGSVLYVGTGDSPATVGFYEHCGFTRSHVVKDFFIRHYDHPIFEGGKQLADMIYLKKEL